MDFYSRLIPRLNGEEIEDRFSYYHSLAKKGVAGFIIFGGEIETVRAKIKELQDAARHPLLISSDLEQGLGQHVNGGTLFPPAMAIGSAIKHMDRHSASDMLEKLYTAFALEAHYAGINVIFAPVMDINTNPDNPIIATRAFGEDPKTVSGIGCRMIHTLQENGIMACAKHFPGHGDTETDSHISLPVIRKDLKALEQMELWPFKKAVEAGVNMIMAGHLSVPSMDPSGRPASISGPIMAYLREKMKFRGLTITDAMNMGSLGGYTEEEASLAALAANVDLLLHPSDPDKVAEYFRQKKFMPKPLKINPALSVSNSNVDFIGHRRLSDEITKRAISSDGSIKIKKPFIIILKDEKEEKGIRFLNAIRKRYSEAGSCSVAAGEDIPWHKLPSGHDIIVAVFSGVRAWKGGTGEWMKKAINSLKEKTRVFISFGNPYVLQDIDDKNKVCAYWDSVTAQEYTAEQLIRIIP